MIFKQIYQRNSFGAIESNGLAMRSAGFQGIPLSVY
jgi:hypothetical protein